VFNVGILTVTD